MLCAMGYRLWAMSYSGYRLYVNELWPSVYSQPLHSMSPWAAHCTLSITPLSVVVVVVVVGAWA
jgi:hypothetical protein